MARPRGLGPIFIQAIGDTVWQVDRIIGKKMKPADANAGMLVHGLRLPSGLKVRDAPMKTVREFVHCWLERVLIRSKVIPR
jgi:hypothetical protein